MLINILSGEQFSVNDDGIKEEREKGKERGGNKGTCTSQVNIKL